MKLLKDGIYAPKEVALGHAPTPNPRPGGGYKLLAALVCFGVLRNVR
jgi:hypothetical protein